MTLALTVKGTSAPERLPPVRVTSLTWASLPKPVSVVVAAAESSVAAAAAVTLPFCQAFRKAVDAMETSAADSGPVLPALRVVAVVPSSADAPLP